MPVDVAGALSILFLGFYVLVNANYLLVHTFALASLRGNATGGALPGDRSVRPGVAVVVPAFEEAETITESVPSFLDLEYPDLEVIVVNDGSTDATFERLAEEYDLEPTEAPFDEAPPCAPIRGVYRSAVEPDLRVVDKENGGKSDALNAGIWLTRKPLFCAVDSDTLIEREALLAVAEPFIDYPEATAATGGTVNVANGCTIEDGRLLEPALSRHPLVSIQAMEYLRAFYLGRLGLSRLKSMLLISGAFGCFRTDIVREIGGYRRDTVTEDFDLVLRLHGHLAGADRDYRIEFVPRARAWTEVPQSLAVLGRQRRRWFRGMVETLAHHRRMIGNPRYGVVGLYALPFYALAEGLGPLLEGLGLIVLPVAVAAGWVDPWTFLAFLGLTSGVGTVLSWYALLGESWGGRAYGGRELARLAVDGVLENVGYRQWKTLVAWRGLIEYLRGDRSWGEMERVGLE